MIYDAKWCHLISHLTLWATILYLYVCLQATRHLAKLIKTSVGTVVTTIYSSMNHFNMFQTRTLEIRRHRCVYKYIHLIQTIFQCIIFNVFEILHAFQIRQYSKWSARTLEISHHKSISKCIKFIALLFQAVSISNVFVQTVGSQNTNVNNLGDSLIFILIDYIPTQLQTHSCHILEKQVMHECLFEYPLRNF